MARSIEDEATYGRQRLFFENGLFLLALGLLMVVVGITRWVSYLFRDVSTGGDQYSELSSLFAVAAFLVTPLAFAKVHKLIISPRLGILASERSRGVSWLSRVLIVVVALFPFICSVVTRANGGAMPKLDVVFGLIITTAYVALVLSIGLKYWLVDMFALAVFSVGLGVLFCRYGSGVQGFLLLLFGLGGALSLDGAWRLWMFIRATPRARHSV